MAEISNVLFELEREMEERKRRNRAEVARYVEIYRELSGTVIISDDNPFYNLLCKFVVCGVSHKYLSKIFNFSVDYITNSNYLHPVDKPEARCFSKPQIMKACENFNYICPYCFNVLNPMEKETITGHHIVPYSRGGLTRIDNCLPLHVKCHYDDFKMLHPALFDNTDSIYGAKYYNDLKKRLNSKESGLLEFRPFNMVLR